MNINKTSLFGVFINAITTDELPKTFENLLISYRKDRKAKYCTSINSLFFNHVHGWLLSEQKSNELYKIITHADLVVLDNPYLCKISKTLGSFSLTPITGEELFQSACAFMEENQLALYVLGGTEETNRTLLGYLRIYYPKIKLVGSSVPFIYTRGERLEESQERDPFIVEAINQSKADLLFLQLGHPKQEIWFERIKSSLQVPLTIGIGGAINRYLTKETSESHPEETLNLSSLLNAFKKFFYRFKVNLKYVTWVTPLFLYSLINENITKLFAKETSFSHRYFFLSSNKSFVVIALPELLIYSQTIDTSQWLEEAIEQDHIVLDFSDLKHIDLHGITLIAEMIKWAKNLGKKIFILNVSPDIRYLIKLNGAWQFFKLYEACTPQEIIYWLSEAGKGPLNYLEFYESIYQEKNEVILSFFGAFGIADESTQLTQKLTPILYQKNCLINLKYCTFIDNKGMGFLLNLRNLQQANGKLFKIINANSEVMQQIKAAKVDSLLSN